nr:hypothetical protein [Tanacetum cinerariifolium]
MVTFMVDLFHDGLFASNHLRYLAGNIELLRISISKDKSGSDFEDVKKGDNLDDVKDIIDFQTEGDENVNIPKLLIDDPWLNKLVGKGRDVSTGKGAGKRGKDRSEPSKVSQATKERRRKKKLEEKENLKNAVDCPFRLWAS